MYYLAQRAGEGSAITRLGAIVITLAVTAGACAPSEESIPGGVELSEEQAATTLRDAFAESTDDRLAVCSARVTYGGFLLSQDAAAFGRILEEGGYTELWRVIDHRSDHALIFLPAQAGAPYFGSDWFRIPGNPVAVMAFCTGEFLEVLELEQSAPDKIVVEYVWRPMVNQDLVYLFSERDPDFLGRTAPLLVKEDLEHVLAMDGRECVSSTVLSLFGDEWRPLAGEVTVSCNRIRSG